MLVKMRNNRHSRNGLRDLANDLKPGTTMLEIGSYAGSSARLFFESGKIDKMYVIDAWLDYVEQGAPLELAGIENLFDSVTMEFKHRIVKIKGDSLFVHDQIKDNSLDFIYIDSLHTYEQLSKELRLYTPKLKENSIIGGHDYEAKTFPGVVKAVNDFCGLPDKIYKDTSWIKYMI